jgi:hypothetical protein
MSPLRKHHYETFYYLHVFLFLSCVVMCALHHPPLWWWCWAALSLWIGERLWRATWWLYINGFFGGMSVTSLPAISQHPSKSSANDQVWELKHLRSSTLATDSLQCPLPPEEISLFGASSLTLGYLPPYSPPPGYAHAELLSGRTVRLTYISPGYVSWAPGQYFLINIPSVSKFFSHPFTCASVCDEQAPTDAGRIMIFFIRVKAGWTRNLWNTLITLSTHLRNHAPDERLPHGCVMPKNGILLRMYVDGPFGSSVRCRWGSHSTVVIVTGGSGISFGLSVLEYVCLCLAGRDGKHLGGRPGGMGMKMFLTNRVRFVWLVREFCEQNLQIRLSWFLIPISSPHPMGRLPSPSLHVYDPSTRFISEYIRHKL